MKHVKKIVSALLVLTITACMNGGGNKKLDEEKQASTAQKPPTPGQAYLQEQLGSYFVPNAGELTVNNAEPAAQMVASLVASTLPSIAPVSKPDPA